MGKGGTIRKRGRCSPSVGLTMHYNINILGFYLFLALFLGELSLSSIVSINGKHQWKASMQSINARESMQEHQWNHPAGASCILLESWSTRTTLKLNVFCKNNVQLLFSLIDHFYTGFF